MAPLSICCYHAASFAITFSLILYQRNFLFVFVLQGKLCEYGHPFSVVVVGLQFSIEAMTSYYYCFSGLWLWGEDNGVDPWPSSLCNRCYSWEKLILISRHGLRMWSWQLYPHDPMLHNRLGTHEWFMMFSLEAGKFCPLVPVEWLLALILLV